MNTEPRRPGSVPELRAMMERLSWAADRAEACHDKATEARELPDGWTETSEQE